MARVALQWQCPDMKNSLYKERRRAKLSRPKLADLVGCHEQTIVKHEGPNWELTREWRDRYAAALGISPDRLLPADLLSKVDAQVTEVPIISWTSAGAPMEALQNLPEDAETVLISTDKQGLYAVRVSGESMNRVAPDGSIVICDPLDKSLVDGRRYIIRIGNETTFKRYRGNNGPVRFEPESFNPDFATFYADQPFEVIARVIHVQTDL